MLLQDKVAVVYGAAGEIGGAVARAFAGEGARVFLTGHLQAPWKLSPRTSFPLADTPRRPRSTLSTNRPWTGICCR